jgi:hypothetical protein
MFVISARGFVIEENSPTIVYDILAGSIARILSLSSISIFGEQSGNSKPKIEMFSMCLKAFNYPICVCYNFT